MDAPLREVHLAKKFGISRNTVRESIQLLVRSGIVERQTNRGARVTRLEAAAASDIFLVRRVIELAALDHVVSNLPDNLRDLRAAFDDLESAGKLHDWEGIVDADLRFHRSLVRALESQRLSALFETIENQLRLALSIVTVTTREFENPDPLVDAHRRVIDALAIGDRQSASAALLDHLSQAERMLMAVLDSALRTTPAIESP